LSDSKSFAVTVVARPTFLNVTLSANGNVTLNWTALPGQNYGVQYKLNLTDAAWLNISNLVTAVTNTASLVDTPGSDAQRFYRVQVLP
jgi:hypothetical protein